MQNKASPDEKAISRPFVTPPLANGVQMPMPNVMHTPCTPTPRTFNGKKYYGVEDVAKIIGVNRTTVLRWHTTQYMGAPMFKADERTHDGRYLYEVERVMQLKDVYHSNWQRGSYEPAPVMEYFSASLKTNTAKI